VSGGMAWSGRVTVCYGEEDAKGRVRNGFDLGVYRSRWKVSSRRMKGSTIALKIKLEAATRQEGDVWLAWCLPLDVMTQAKTKDEALQSLKEAVELWFESCISRNVLEKALREAGFLKVKAGEMPPKDASIVEVQNPKEPLAHAFSAKRDYIEVSIPAYIATQCNLENLRASR
jgi:predicted RNase H-like HicB family nuclease